MRLEIAVQDVDLSRRKSTEIIYYVIRSITNWLPHIDVMLFFQICVVCMLKSWPIQLPIEILPEFRPLSLHSALSLDYNVVTMQNKFQLSSVIDDTNVTHYSSTQQSAFRPTGNVQCVKELLLMRCNLISSDRSNWRMFVMPATPLFNFAKIYSISQ